MKRLHIFFMTILLNVSCLILAGCSNNGDDTQGESSSDYIEVTINGKTYRHSVLGIYSSIPADIDGVRCYFSTEDVFDDNGFSVFYSLNCYEDLDRLLQCPTGNYDVVTTEEYVDDAGNLSFSLDYEDDEDFYEIKSGRHMVTSIKPIKEKTPYGTSDAVQVEGTFDLTMTAESYTSDSQCNIKGKYRMSIFQ